MLRRLGSPKLAAWLIGALMLMTLVAVVVPQSGYLGDEFERFASEYPALASALGALGLTELFGGWAIAVVALLLFGNIASCTWLRVQRRRRPVAVGAPRSAAARSLAEGLSAAGFLQAATAALDAARWRILARDERGIVAARGESGFWGSLVLHVGMLVVIVGGAVTAPTAFYGRLVLADGQTVIDEPASYADIINEPEIGEGYSGARVSLDSTKVTYERGQVVQTLAKMRAIEPSGRVISRDVRVNHPLDAAGKSYLLQASGYSVSLLVSTGGGRAVPIVVNLAEETPRGWRDRIEVGPVDGQPVTLELTATPVPLAGEETLPVEKYRLDDPRLELAVVSAGRSIGTTPLAQGETAEPTPGLRVTFERLGLWDSFYVRGEPGRWVSYVGFWMIVAGAAWRFAVPERRILITVDDGSARIAHRARPWAGVEADRDRALVATIAAAASTPQEAPDAAPEDSAAHEGAHDS